MEQKFPLERFWENGFCIVPNVFGGDEVERWKAAGQGHANRDMFGDDVLRALVLEPRVLALARRILKRDQLVYFGDSNPMVGRTDAGFHKDNADKGDDQAPDWQGDYPIVRFGLYTDDHVDRSGGLDLRLGSHRTASVSTGRYVAARTRPGDLVIWNLRTSHSGGTMLLRSGTAVDPSSLAGKLLRRVPLGLLVPPHPNRIGLFWTYGLAGPHLDRYIAYLATRRYAVERWLDMHYAEAWITQAADAGVTVREVRRDRDTLSVAAAHDNHVALPY